MGVITEPDQAERIIASGQADLVSIVRGQIADPHLARFLPDPEQRARAAEWLARVVLTYVLNPADGVDLTDPVAARRLLRTFVLPGLTAVPTPTAPARRNP